ncbi:helix-turn-helix domain-containing protein [Actinosynnema sp. NPDC020468]|uniref:TetR/AcrR family transcriptional regulator n=1 Tax=Actinosynnema sp. NPDC020468 TaxID=3154488 RepID=UPI00341064F0
MRADAVRNRARLVEIADELFAARGHGVSTETIAKAAGVGVGTVFRHFPTKEALLREVYVTRLERLVDRAETLMAHREPGEAFFAFITEAVDWAAAKNATAEALVAAGVDVADVAVDVAPDLRRAFRDLLAGAKRVGAVRPDLEPAALSALLVGLARAAEHAKDDPIALAAVLDVFRDGMRPHPA